MTNAQRRAFETLFSHYGLTIDHERIDLKTLFQNSASPLVLEIGFGMGDALIEMAQNNPQMNFIGIEVYRPGIGALLHAIVEKQLNNVRVFYEDAVEVLERCFHNHVFSRVQIFFPDPWPKKRHHKRRLIQTDFVTLLQHKLCVGGILHVVTDWEDYAIHVREVMNSHSGFKEVFLRELTDSRVITKFEKAAQGAGRKIWEMQFMSCAE